MVMEMVEVPEEAVPEAVATHQHRDRDQDQVPPQEA